MEYAEYEQLRKYGRCEECDQINTGYEWCQKCNSQRFQQNFNNWTSDNDSIDKFIQNTQLSANNNSKVLEWILYDRLCNIEYIHYIENFELKQNGKMDL